MRSRHPERGRRAGVALVLATGACAIAAGLFDVGRGEPPVSSASTRPYSENPHWKADRCGSCHTMADGRPRPIPPGAVDAICLDCHDGKRGRRERHPMGRTFSGRQTVRPEGWPLENGRLICATCHEMILACQLDAAARRDNGDFLRGFERGSLLGFCERCHVSEEHRPYRVHSMVGKDGGLIEPTCRFCHQGLLDQRGRMVRMNDPALRSDPITMCASCHVEHRDWFSPGHIGVRVKPEMKAYMAAMDIAAGQPERRPTETQIREALRTRREPVRLPLSDGDTVVCSTCHNPHQAGLFPAGSVLAYGAMQSEAKEESRRLRGLGRELCIGCHNK